MQKEFLNYTKVYDDFVELFLNCIDDAEMYEDVIEDYAHNAAISTLEDMRKYVHQQDTSMSGNFADIRQDWNVIKDFVISEVEPWGDFDEIISTIDEGTISDEDLEKFQTWCLEWFYTAFGTWGLCYNFQTLISELEYERERELECA